MSKTILETKLFQQINCDEKAMLFFMEQDPWDKIGLSLLNFQFKQCMYIVQRSDWGILIMKYYAMSSKRHFVK